jgi:hypothetical protein
MSDIDQRRKMKELDMRLASCARPGFNHSYEGRFDAMCNKFQRYIDDKRAFATTHEPLRVTHLRAGCTPDMEDRVRFQEQTYFQLHQSAPLNQPGALSLPSRL